MASDQQLNQRWGDWLVRSQAGDRVAYEALLNEMNKLLRAYLRSKISDAQAIADVTQEILLGVHRARASYDPGKPVAPWFFAIVHYKLTDYYRSFGRSRRLRQAMTEQSSTSSSWTSAPEAGSDALELLEEVLAELPPKQRQAVQLLKVEGLSTQEAADRMDVSLSALKVNAHRGYKSILKKLRPDHQD